MSTMDLGRFPPDIRGKVVRISDVAGRIYSVPFLLKRLAFYGGTCLNFVHLKSVPRLSLDLDFNYRDIGSGDWGDERERVDEYLKKILSDLGYPEQDIRIQAKYPLTRFEVWYSTPTGGNDSFKVEIGYQRRMPILPSDTYIDWTHPFSGRAVDVLTPAKEELFSNKVATLLYRFRYPDHFSGRDLFDVYTISQEEFERGPFLASFVLDSLTRPERRLDEIPAQHSIEHTTVEGKVEELIFDGPAIEVVSGVVSEFLEGLLDEVRRDWRGLIEDLFQRHRFDPEQLIASHTVNKRIGDHPGILWSLERLRKGGLQISGKNSRSRTP